MSNKKVQCYDENGRPRCHYYSITRYGRICSYDGTWNPCKTKCKHFIPVEQIHKMIIKSIDEELEKIRKKKSCHNCIWRSYKDGNQMTCDNIMARHEMKTNPKFYTPCEWFELDETGEEYLIRQIEGYNWIKKERNLERKLKK